MKRTKLKRCPFCGGKAGLRRENLAFLDADGYRVECYGKCKSKTTCWHTDEQAIEAWNQRATATR